MILFFSIASDRHAQSSRQRSRSMTGAERVVFRFVAAEEPADAAILLDCRKLITTAGQNLVGVRLMAHVPHQTIVRSVESVMQRHRQFDRAQRGAGVAANT